MEQEKLENLMKKYKISEEQYFDILKLIKYTLFMGKVPVEQPEVVIIGGQPGAGKSGFIMYSKNEFEDENVVTINSDEIRSFYPNSEEIAKLYPAYYTHITNEITGRWTSSVLKEAIDNKYQFIFEGTLKNERIFDRLKELRENNYKIIVRALSVPFIESLVSMYERYEKQIQMRGYGRMIPNDHHNFTYHAIPTVIGALEQSEYFDLIEIYARGEGARTPKLIYSKDKTQKVKHNEKGYMSAKEAIIKQRSEEHINCEELKNRLKMIKIMKSYRNTTIEEKEAFEKLERIIKNHWKKIMYQTLKIKSRKFK